MSTIRRCIVMFAALIFMISDDNGVTGLLTHSLLHGHYKLLPRSRSVSSSFMTTIDGSKSIRAVPVSSVSPTGSCPAAAAATAVAPNVTATTSAALRPILMPDGSLLQLFSIGRRWMASRLLDSNSQQQKNKEMEEERGDTTVSSYNSNEMIGYERVGGCAANTFIKTSALHYSSSTNDKNNSRNENHSTSSPLCISVDGFSDSDLSAGLIAALSEALHGRPAADVVGLLASELLQNISSSSTEITDQHGIGLSFLSGPGAELHSSILHQMLAVIQRQTHRILYVSAVSSQSSTEGDKTDLYDKIKRYRDFNSQHEDKRESIINITSNNHINNRHIATVSSSTASAPDGSVSNRENEVAMLLSGGVDSSVAMKQLLLQGHKVRAYYLKIWLADELSHLNECPWEEDLRYAQDVCDQLGVPLETVSLQQEYWDRVVAYVIAECKAGRTPNPDMFCNSRIKFGAFMECVGRHHKYVASGHYAQVVALKSNTSTSNSNNNDNDKDNDYDYIGSISDSSKNGISDGGSSSNFDSGKVKLFQSPDAVKDQSYFLSTLSQEQLQKCVFPIGHLRKEQVRALAKHYNLCNKDRKDSQGICFLGKIKYSSFIEHCLGENPGDIVLEDDRTYSTPSPPTSPRPSASFAASPVVVGRHRGLWFYTEGQRKGLGSPHLFDQYAYRGPWYVTRKDAANNRLFIRSESERAAAAAEEEEEEEEEGGREGGGDGETAGKGRTTRQSEGEQVNNRKDGGEEKGRKGERRSTNILFELDNVHWINGRQSLAPLFTTNTNTTATDTVPVTAVAAAGNIDADMDSGELVWKCYAKLRHGPSICEVLVRMRSASSNSSSNSKSSLQVEILRPGNDAADARGVAPGQFVVFYQQQQQYQSHHNIHGDNSINANDVRALTDGVSMNNIGVDSSALECIGSGVVK